MCAYYVIFVLNYMYNMNNICTYINKKKGKLMKNIDSKTLGKLKNIFELSLVLNDSINFNWNEGAQGYYQLALSSIITKKFIEFFEDIDQEYVDIILQRM